MKRLVIGILAHVDSGKTTLSEGLLYRSGHLKKLGRVDHGDAFLDSFALERERGITIFSKQAILPLDAAELTLLDTPGHVDFSPEMERTLEVLDYAILLISGTDGVQSHSETLWRLLAQHHIPCFVFVNKMDLAGADHDWVLQELKKRFSQACTDFTGAQFGEELALCDESLLSEFLENGQMSDPTIATAILERKVFPCYFGCALRLQGIDALLDGLRRFTLEAKAGEVFGGKVFKIARDEQSNRLTTLKVTGGSLKVRDLLAGRTAKEELWAEKVNQIRLYSGAKFQTIDEAFPGMLCTVTGLSQTRPGEGLGLEKDAPLPQLEPVLTYRVILPPEEDARTVLAKLRLLEEEEPELHLLWKERLQEIHVQLMGEVQVEILKSLIWQRFGINLSFGEGNIVYKETITNTVEGVGHYEPLRHYAEVHLLLSPGEPGSGLCFSSSCSEDKLSKNWQQLVLTHLREKTHLGVLTASPITDLKITLLNGRGHQKHTEGGDFRQATYRAVRQGLKQAESVLLEPWYSFRLEVPSETVGRAMSDLQRMNASFAPPQIQGIFSVLKGTIPVSCMRGYPLEVTNYTKGHGRLSFALEGYFPCHNAEEVIAARAYDSESDLLNSADSVFCSHGVGLLVKWDHVKEYMHLEPSLVRPSLKAIAPAPLARRAAAYCATLEQDQELMAIFERTYGPVRRDSRSAFRTAHKPPSPPKEKESAPKEDLSLLPDRISTGPEYLLVDGYNIIFAWDDLSALARESLDAARHRLTEMLCNYQGFCQCELILVFDAYKVKGNPGEVEKFRNISVVYTKEAETADMYIEKVTHKLGKTKRVRVASSDGMEQLIILSHGALRLPALSFREELNEVEKAIRGFLEA